MKRTSLWMLLIIVLTMVCLEGCLLRRRPGLVIPTSTVGAGTIQPIKTEQHLNISYKSVPAVKAKYLSLDVYAVQGATGLPVMIFVHGGAWTMGDKSYVDLKPDYFNRSGFVFISVNYRLSPAFVFPVQPEDVASAVAWVHAHIENYGGDPEKIFLMGHSAGAQLVALIGTDARYLQSAGLDLGNIKGIISLDTQAYDLTKVIHDSPQEEAFYTSVFGIDPSGWEAASPVSYVSAGKGIPPMVVAYSGGLMGQGTYTRQQAAEEFAAKLQGVGVETLLVPAPEKSHAEINREFGEPDDPVTLSAMGFLQQIIAELH